MTVNDLFTPQKPAPEAPAPVSHRRRTIVLVGVVFGLIGMVTALLVWYLATGKPLSQLPGLNQDTRSPHYLFSMYGTKQPLGVAVTADGDRVYVTESGGPRLVHVYGRSGDAVGTLKPPGTGAHVPVYAAVDPVTREVYVSDRMTAAVYVYGPDNAYRRTFTPKGDAARGWAPLGLAFDAKGRLYVTDVRAKGAQRVLVFGTDGTLIRSVTANDGLTYPNGVAVDGRGDVEVADSNNARVLMLSTDGQVLGRIVGGGDESALGLPRGVAVDDEHHLYVVDAANHAVRMYTMTDNPSAVPTYQSSFGTEGTGDGAFEYPNGIAADSRGRVYVTDRENDRLQVWSY